MSGDDWTIVLPKERDAVLDAMLQEVEPGWIVDIDHDRASGTFEWVGVHRGAVLVRPWHPDQDGGPGRLLDLDFEGLSKIGVH